MTEQWKDATNNIDKREWNGCIAIARDLLVFTETKTCVEIDAIEERILYELGKTFKDAALHSTMLKGGEYGNV